MNTNVSNDFKNKLNFINNNAPISRNIVESKSPLSIPESPKEIPKTKEKKGKSGKGLFFFFRRKSKKSEDVFICSKTISRNAKARPHKRPPINF